MPAPASWRDRRQGHTFSRCRSPGRAMRALAVAAICAASGQALSDPQPAILSGLPQQVIPTYPEIGLGSFTMRPVGSVSLLPGSTTSGTGTGAGTSSGSGSSAISTMLAQGWGPAASANAAAMGVNPSALAATCVVESGCQNVTGTGTVAGAFQMKASTYTASLNAALQQNPSLGTNIVQGLAGQMDPATESIAASQYLLQGAQSLQSAGIAIPTVLQVRGFYNFGPSNGAALANAPDDATMASVMPQISATTLTNNGIRPGETVGQWRAAVAAKIGDAAGQPVMLARG